MTPEERFERIERLLEFSAGILAQLCDSQQRQDAEIAQNSRQIEQSFRQIEQNASQIEQSFRQIEQNASQIEQNSRQIAQLAEAISTLARVSDGQGDRIEAGFKRMEERQARTDEQMKHTDDRLSALIAVVERHFSAGHQ